MSKPKETKLTDEEVAERRDDILRHMLNQPPETHDEMVKRRRKHDRDKG